MIGDVKGMEMNVYLSGITGEPVIGDDGNATFTVEEFITQVIEYHNNLENEQPVKYVCFYFYETNDITVVRRTVDLLKKKEEQVTNA